jgi:hypothetical protein
MVENSSVGWKEVDQALRRLARLRSAQDYEEGRWLLAARRTAVHVHFGFASLAEYVERVLGYDPRTTAERLRVAEALEILPAVSQALREGAITWSAVREITRVAVPQTEKSWLLAVAGKTVRQVEEIVAGHRPGDHPDDTPDPSLRTRVIRLELRPEALALFREAVGRLRRDVDPQLTDEDVVAEMARRILGGTVDESAAPYQVMLTVCDRCGRTWQKGRGEEIEVDPEVAERAACDAQNVSTHVGARATRSIPPATRRLVVRRDGGRCRVPGCRNTQWLEVHHHQARSEGGTNDPENLILLCGAHHRLLHRGFLTIEGNASSGLVFRQADGTPYGDAAAPEDVEACAEAFAALKALGLKDGEARRALAAARAHVGASAPAEELVRKALQMQNLPVARTHATQEGTMSP